jgi:hypothetical protein
VSGISERKVMQTRKRRKEFKDKNTNVEKGNEERWQKMGE